MVRQASLPTWKDKFWWAELQTQQARSGEGDSLGLEPLKGVVTPGVTIPGDFYMDGIQDEHVTGRHLFMDGDTFLLLELMHKPSWKQPICPACHQDPAGSCSPGKPGQHWFLFLSDLPILLMMLDIQK